MTEENLIEIRCPQSRTSKVDKSQYLCNRICVKVTPGSGGEARCRSCHLSFLFSTDSQARVNTGIKVQKIEN